MEVPEILPALLYRKIDKIDPTELPKNLYSQRVCTFSLITRHQYNNVSLRMCIANLTKLLLIDV